LIVASWSLPVRKMMVSCAAEIMAIAVAKIIKEIRFIVYPFCMIVSKKTSVALSVFIAATASKPAG
jgi:hypothetical protein